MSGRERILARIREAVGPRPTADHPGAFGGWRPEESARSVVEAFTDRFEDAGGEWIRFESHAEASAWARDFADHFERVTMGRLAVWPMRFGEERWTPPGVTAADGAAWIHGVDPAEADLGISLADGAVAETGSLILGARDGRRVQLLPPVHLVLVDERKIFPTLLEALTELRGADAFASGDEFGVDLDAEVHDGLPSALGLHSGPSKSADIGQVLVKGVHGPGRLVAVIVGEE